MSWPQDTDGDVFRRLELSNFDFSAPHEIEFNVDFGEWPPASEAIRWLSTEYKQVNLFPPSAKSNGYVQLKLTAMLTYGLVITTQERASAAMARYGGVCESWGVLHSSAP